jgi:hypothetical protein
VLVEALALILLCVSVNGLLLGWVLRGLGVVSGALIAFSAGVLLRLGAGLLIAWTAVEAARRGGIGFAVLATWLVVLALGIVALEAFRVWAARKYGLSHD